MSATPFHPHGRHFIGGARIATAAQFDSAPADGPAHAFSVGTPELVDQACRSAEEAFWSFGYSTREQRAGLLETIADEIEARGDAITGIGAQETGLPAARLVGERGRTVMQLRLFASDVRLGEHLDRRHDPALPDRRPQARPELRLMQRPIGPVAVFGASNFPLAFSVAGGDTASALAAGCPVVVKGHSAHPGTSEIVAEAVLAAIGRCGVHPGAFSLVQGGRRDVGEALVRHPLIRAVGFTGSLAGGRALFDLCAARPDPIPFFGELGSVNPMFLLPAAAGARAEAIGAGWAASLAEGAGQFCTNPGIAVVQRGPAGEAFAQAAHAGLSRTPPQVMLTDGIAAAYRAGRDRIADGAGVQALLTSTCDLREATPQLFRVTARDWLGNHALAEEVFGPLGLIVTVDSPAEMLDVARSLAGQLTVTLHMDDADRELARALLPILERKAGRLLANGFPTGVEVCDAMVHGGPYPASTNFGATSVGTLSIRRWLRPVCYQDLPDSLFAEGLALNGMAEPRRLPAPLRVLRGQFGLFYAGNGLSLIGTWMQRIACGWLVWDWTHSVFWLGILSAADLLPVMAIGPFAGVAADRWDRLRQNMLAQSASALIAVSTAVLLATGHLGIVGIVLLTTVQGTLAAIIQPARLSMIQQLVRREDLGTAVALNSVNVNLARLLGPAAAGAMILYADIVWVFAVNAAVTLLFVVVLGRLRLVPYARTASSRGFMDEMAEGFVHILRAKPLWLILLAMLCGGSMVRAMAELMPAIAAGVFTDNATGLAVLTGAAAVGAVVSGLSMGSGRPARLLYGALLWWGLGAVTAVLLTQAPNVATAVSAAVVLGFAITRGLVSTQTFVQLTTPDELRGRVLSVHGLIARGSPALGALLIGFAADRIGLARAVEWSSAALVLSLLVLVPLARDATVALPSH